VDKFQWALRDQAQNKATGLGKITIFRIHIDSMFKTIYWKFTFILNTIKLVNLRKYLPCGLIWINSKIFVNGGVTSFKILKIYVFS